MMSVHIKGLGAGVLAVMGVLAWAAPSEAAARVGPTIWNVAGSGTPCSTVPICGDGGPATSAQLNFPEGVAADAAGNVYTADWGNNEVRRLSADGVLTVIAGDGTPCSSPPGCGDGGPATNAKLNFPQAIALDSAGNVYVADTGNNEVRKISSRGIITRVAGTGSACSAAPSCGDGGSALRASLSAPGGVAVDRAGNVYIADSGDNEVRKVSPRGVITRVAGDGRACATAPSCGDGGSAMSARLNGPLGLALDSLGRLYLVDGGDNEVRRISRGTITRFAGDGTPCAGVPGCGDGHPAASAQLNLPEGVAVDPGGSVYIADWGDNVVRVVSPAGTIATLAGTGATCASPPSCGDGGPATGAALSAPQGVAVDGAGDIVIADTEDHQLRLITPAGAGPASLTAPGGKIALLGFGPSVTRARVTVRYVLTGDVPLTLSVRAPGAQPRVVARANGHAGAGQLTWNRKLGSRPAPAGRYQLIVTGTVGGASAQSTVTARL